MEYIVTNGMTLEGLVSNLKLFVVVITRKIHFFAMVLTISYSIMAYVMISAGTTAFHIRRFVLGLNQHDKDVL